MDAKLAALVGDVDVLSKQEVSQKLTAALELYYVRASALSGGFRTGFSRIRFFSEQFTLSYCRPFRGRIIHYEETRCKWWFGVRMKLLPACSGMRLE